MELPEDLKRYRAPRERWTIILAVAVLVAVASILGPIDFAYQLDLESENKVLRAKVAAMQKPKAEVAPIRPLKKCGNDPHIAAQPDGGRWKVSCAPSADLTKRTY